MTEHQPKMLLDEVLIEDSMVRRLLQTQFPQWAAESLKRLPDSGTDSAIYRLGEDWAFACPASTGPFDRWTPISNGWSSSPTFGCRNSGPVGKRGAWKWLSVPMARLPMVERHKPGSERRIDNRVRSSTVMVAEEVPPKISAGSGSA